MTKLSHYKYLRDRASVGKGKLEYDGLENYFVKQFEVRVFAGYKLKIMGSYYQWADPGQELHKEKY